MKQENKNVTQKKSKLRMYIVLLFIAIVFIVGYVIVRGSYLETLEIGQEYLSVFWQNVNYTAITFGANFIILFILIYWNNHRIKKGLKAFFTEEKKEMPKLPNKSISFILSILISAISSKAILNNAMLCFNSTSFGITDPVLGYDIGYFMFQKPFIELMLTYVLILIIGLTVYTAVYYIIAFNVYFEGINRETLKKSHLLKQAFVNIMLIAILIASLVFINTQNVGIQKFLNLQENITYSIYGAGLTDTTIKLWGYRILSIVIVISVYMAIKFFKNGKTKKVIASILAVPIYIISMTIVLIGFQVIFVTPNELDKEKVNIQNNINYTKNAYGINIEEINVQNGGETITEELISNNRTTINNIAIVSKDITLKDLNANQTSKGYYTYKNTQIASYNINGKQQLVYVTPREIATSSNGTYNNKTYEYTHGYGVIITSAVSTTQTGNLNNIQKNFEHSSNNAVSISEPRIYFGLQTNDTVVTNSENTKEFDYPILSSNTAENAENVYDGEAGLNLNLIDRFILAIREKDLKLAFSANVNKNSKILTNRNIIKRAETIMPYLLYDEEPYLVVNDNGKLIWVLDAYTSSNNYPYSQKTTIQKDSLTKLELNYIRNSIKVLIDAYDGTITFYITDRTDPIAIAYEKIYPNLFANKDETIDTSISEQFVYPEFLYQIQAEMITRYHNVQPDVLYRGDDVWDIATHNTGKVSTKTGTEITPYYTMVKTVEKEEARLGLVLPFTPYSKQNIISYMVGSYENGIPKLAIYKFSSDSNILGPMQLDTQIEQDEKVSKEIESLNVTGTKITKEMIIVPIENTLLYVEPIYQQYINETDSLPTLKKVIVASGNKLAIGENLTDALKNLVSQYAVDIEIENTDNIEDLVKAIIKANNNLKQSSENNDWEMIGKDMQKLQELIDKLDKIVEQEEKEQEDKIANTTNDINEIKENIIANELQ